MEGALPPAFISQRHLTKHPVSVQTGSIARNVEPTMPKILAALIALGLLAGCQTPSEEDRPIIKASDCKPRDLESGACVPE
jgi:hypothetical protein